MKINSSLAKNPKFSKHFQSACWQVTQQCRTAQYKTVKLLKSQRAFQSEISTHPCKSLWVGLQRIEISGDYWLLEGRLKTQGSRWLRWFPARLLLVQCLHFSSFNRFTQLWANLPKACVELQQFIGRCRKHHPPRHAKAPLVKVLPSLAYKELAGATISSLAEQRYARIGCPILFLEIYLPASVSEASW